MNRLRNQSTRSLHEAAKRLSVFGSCLQGSRPPGTPWEAAPCRMLSSHCSSPMLNPPANTTANHNRDRLTSDSPEGLLFRDPQPFRRRHVLSSEPSRGHPRPSTSCPGGKIGRRPGVPFPQLSPQTPFCIPGLHVTFLIFSISTLPLFIRYFSLSIHIFKNRFFFFLKPIA